MSVRLEEKIAHRFSGDPSQPVLWWKGVWEDAAETERKTALCAETSAAEDSSPAAASRRFCPTVRWCFICPWRPGGSAAPSFR
jgi:hypothetical protein